MKKNSILTLLIFCSLVLSSQNTFIQDKLTLNTGEVFHGEIQLKTQTLIIIKTTSGERFQFPLSEIKSIEKTEFFEKKTTINDKEVDIISEGFVKGSLDVFIGLISAKNLLEFSPNFQMSMIFGSEFKKNKNFFLGLGVGYNTTTFNSGSSHINLLPLFLRLQQVFFNKTLSPYALLDAGYAFGLHSDYDGGPFASISTGYSYQFNEKSAVKIGFFVGINSIAATLTEQRENQNYTYYGRTTMESFGLRTTLMF